MVLGRYTSPTIFSKGFHLGWKHHNSEENIGSELKENPGDKNLIYHGKILINKSWLNFWGVTDLLPCNRLCVTLAPSGVYTN